MLESPDALIGKQLGNYVITGLLGEGGMAVVYLAEHPEIGRKVAVKVLKPQLMYLPDAAERFIAEARVVARISHPNVVDLYDFGRLDNDLPYYVMEHLQGEDLRALIKQQGRFSATEVLPYLDQICRGLDAAHQLGVIHRDLKPENIFILDRDPPQLKILDFGLAKLLENDQQGSGLTLTGMLMGTPKFISPEQAAGELESITPRSDLYSLGVILYLMLGGETPFNARSAGLLITEHIVKQPPPLRGLEPSVPPPVAAVVERCLEKQPAARPASALELLQCYERALGRAPTVSTRTTRRWIWWAAAACGGVLLVLVWLLLGQPRPQPPARPGRAAVGVLEATDRHGPDLSRPTSDRVKARQQPKTGRADALIHDAVGQSRVTIQLEGTPRGARVLLWSTGRQLSTLPGTFRWPRSQESVKIVVRHRGYLPWTSTIKPSQDLVQRVQLRRHQRPQRLARPGPGRPAAPKSGKRPGPKAKPRPPEHIPNPFLDSTRSP